MNTLYNKSVHYAVHVKAKVNYLVWENFNGLIISKNKCPHRILNLVEKRERTYLKYTYGDIISFQTLYN